MAAAVAEAHSEQCQGEKRYPLCTPLAPLLNPVHPKRGCRKLKEHGQTNCMSILHEHSMSMGEAIAAVVAIWYSNYISA